MNFGEYANPSFEAVVETVTKAKQGGIMSIEASVDEVYGDTKDDDWKAEEVQRIKAQTGVESMSETTFTFTLEKSRPVLTERRRIIPTTYSVLIFYFCSRQDKD